MQGHHDELSADHCQDVRQAARAILNDWPVTPEAQALSVKIIIEALQKDKLSTRTKLSAINALAKLNAQNMELARRDSGSPDLHIQHSGNVNATVDLSKLNLEDLGNLANAARKLDA